MLNINDCRELFIEEQEKKYVIKFINNHNQTVVIEFNKDETGTKRLSDLLCNILNAFSINGVNQSMSKVNSYSNASADLLLCNSGKKISLNVYNQVFVSINKLALDKYLVSREEFFKNANINNIVIDAKTNSRKFELTDNQVNLTLNANLNMNICVPERVFIRDFLQYRCGGRIINIEYINDKNGINESCVATCGEFKMIFPAGYTYSTIIGIINDHNDEIVESRRRR